MLAQFATEVDALTCWCSLDEGDQDGRLLLTYLVAAVAHRVSLTLGFAIIGAAYAVGCVSAVWPAPAIAQTEAEPEPQLTTSG